MTSNSQTVLQDLIQKRNDALENSKAWKNEAARVDAQIAEIINPEDILRNAGKLTDGGSTTVEMNGGKFNIAADKTVKWNSDILRVVASKMPWNIVSTLFKITFEMSETKYKSLKESAAVGMIDADLLKHIDEARTVSVGEPKIKSAEIIS